MAKHKYLVLFRNQPPKNPSSGPSPEDMQRMLQAYTAWKDKFQDAILDMGDKLGSDGRVVTASGVADGPFVEVKEVVGGYMLLTADSLAGAVDIMKAIPGLAMPGASFEIRPLSGASM